MALRSRNDGGAMGGARWGADTVGLRVGGTLPCVDFVDRVRIRTWGAAEGGSESERIVTGGDGIEAEADTGSVADAAMALSGPSSERTFSVLQQLPMAMAWGKEWGR